MTATAYDEIATELPALLPRLWRYGLVLTRDPIAAEDLVQATCLRALERSSQFAVGTRLDRWLFSILRSIWINQLRAQRIRSGHGLVDPEDVLVTDGERQIETNIFAGQVLKRALGLPEAQRETSVTCLRRRPHLPRSCGRPRRSYRNRHEPVGCSAAEAERLAGAFESER